MSVTTTSSLIIGIGKTGLSCARYLLQQGKSIIMFDTRSTPPEKNVVQAEFPSVPLYLASLPEEVWNHVDQVILSPGVDPKLPILAPARNRQLPIIGDIELFAQQATAPVVAITGTNAKGTVTTLIAAMLQQAGYQVQVGGNIGTPALELLAAPKPDFYVLELSSFQLETTYSLVLQAATILNVSEDHLDRHGTLPAYIAAKQRIYQHARAIIWNREDKATYPHKLPVGSQIFNFGSSVPKNEEFGLRQVQGQFYLAFGEELLLPTSQLTIQGQHNWLNALAALTLGHALKVPMAAMLTALSQYHGLPHRCEWVRTINGVNWYNDSKGTNVGASVAAIKGLGSAVTGKLILIAGGLGKGADFSPMYAPVAQYVKCVVLLGTDAPLLAKVLQTATAIEYVTSLAQAVHYAYQQAQPGDAVLLSPACASWDMFRDYNERGEIFIQLVKALPQ